MALNTLDARHRVKRSIISGQTPTFNTQENFTDGTFLTTDIRPGEFFYNMVDERLFIAHSTGINEINVTASGATNDFCSTGIKASAITGCTNLSIIEETTEVAQFNSSGLTIGQDKGISFGSGPYQINAELDLGDWDMDATSALALTHGLSATEWKTIRSISVIIRNDADSLYYQNPAGSSSNNDLYISSFDSARINIERRTFGKFDSTDFNATSYNRGWVTITYTPD